MSGEPFAAVAAVADAPLKARFGAAWRRALWLSAALVLLLALTLLLSLLSGVGIWGVNVPYVWGFDLINYAWWIGVANGASLFAAILVLRRHDLRTAVNRFAESVALFAVICAGMFPIVHLGRPWLFWWVYPYPATYQVWPQFRSTLTWDFWAISTHVIVTTLLWYVGLVPDLATLRDRSRTLLRARIYSVFALGWRGSVRHWSTHQSAYRFTAVLVLPLILMMQSVVALEFATTLAPGWHESRLPIHFVATGLAQGLSAVLVIAVLLRHGLGLERLIDDGDIDLLARLTLGGALASALLYAIEVFTALLADPVSSAAILNRMTGTYAAFYWLAVALSVAVPQLFWARRLRLHPGVSVLVGLSVGTGIWFDRYSLIIGGLEREYLASAEGYYRPSLVEFGLLFGSVGLFAAFLLLFARTLPAVAMFEARHDEAADQQEKAA